MVAALLAALCASPSCSRSRPPPTARHLVLVTIDTLRADRVGVYSGVDLTPRLDRIAREGAYAANAMTHVPLTRPSHATILSGLLPWEVGVRDNLAPVRASVVASPRRNPERGGLSHRARSFLPSCWSGAVDSGGDSIGTTTIFRKPRAPTS